VTSAARFRLLLPRAIYDEMVAQAQAELPAECCGLLAGNVPTASELAKEVRVERRYELKNALESPTEYESDGASMFAAWRDRRERKLEFVAVYHSHPSSAPVPSRKDLERNYYGDTVVHFILSLAGPKPEMRGWWLRETDYEAAEWEIV
jgi:[CysO sulfur-carrier protein]-S-L-cysteine hydrolase